MATIRFSSNPFDFFFGGSLHIVDIISSCKKAFSQIIGDLETFVQLMEYFLTKEEFEKLDLGFTVSVTSLDDVTEEDICKKCRIYIYEDSKKYTYSEERKVFGNNDLIYPTENSLEVFKTISTLYVGGASIIELKTRNDGYCEENKRIDIVNKRMKETILDKLLDKESQETKGMNVSLDKNIQDKCEINKMIKLGPEQNSIFMSEIGLHQSYALIAPWGGGKSMLLELELERAVALHNKSKEPVKMFVVVYEMKASCLLQHYQSFVDDLEKKNNIEIKVMNLRQICGEFSVKYESR